MIINLLDYMKPHVNWSASLLVMAKIVEDSLMICFNEK